MRNDTLSRHVVRNSCLLARSSVMRPFLSDNQVEKLALTNHVMMKRQLVATVHALHSHGHTNFISLLIRDVLKYTAICYSYHDHSICCTVLQSRVLLLRGCSKPYMPVQMARVIFMTPAPEPSRLITAAAFGCSRYQLEAI